MSASNVEMVEIAVALTESKLQALHGKKNKSTKLIPDRDGLYISCGLNGKLSWVYRYRYDGKQGRMTFGTYPALNLTEAREKAVGYNRIIIEGHDPKHHTKKSKRVSIEECAKEWLEKKVANLKPKTQTLYNSQASIYFKESMFSYDVQTARRDEWIMYFDRVAQRSSLVNAGAVLKSLKAMLRWCKQRSFITDSVVLDFNVDAVGAKSKVGERNLQMHEVGILWGYLNRSKATPAIKSCLKLLIIFGARNSEIREAYRSEFDLERGVWTLPAERSKNGKSIRRPIPQKAEAIIRELDDAYGIGGYLIPGEHRGTYLTTSSITRFINRTRANMLKEHNIPPFKAHDFRRTVSTRLSEIGVLPHVTEKMIGHELGGIMAVYNKHDWINEQREAYEMWCEMISKAAQEESRRTTMGEA